MRRKCRKMKLDTVEKADRLCPDPVHFQGICGGTSAATMIKSKKKDGICLQDTSTNDTRCHCPASNSDCNTRLRTSPTQSKNRKPIKDLGGEIPIRRKPNEIEITPFENGDEYDDDDERPPTRRLRPVPGRGYEDPVLFTVNTIVTEKPPLPLDINKMSWDINCTGIAFVFLSAASFAFLMCGLLVLRKYTPVTMKTTTNTNVNHINIEGQQCVTDHVIVITRGDKKLSPTYTQVIACVLADNKRRVNHPEEPSSGKKKDSIQSEQRFSRLLSSADNADITKDDTNNRRKSSAMLSRAPSVNNSNNNPLRTVVIRESGPDRRGGIDCRIRDLSSPNGRYEYEATAVHDTHTRLVTGCCVKSSTESTVDENH